MPAIQHSSSANWKHQSCTLSSPQAQRLLPASKHHVERRQSAESLEVASCELHTHFANQLTPRCAADIILTSTSFSSRALGLFLGMPLPQLPSVPRLRRSQLFSWELLPFQRACQPSYGLPLMQSCCPQPAVLPRPVPAASSNSSSEHGFDPIAGALQVCGCAYCRLGILQKEYFKRPPQHSAIKRSLPQHCPWQQPTHSQHRIER